MQWHFQYSNSITLPVGINWLSQKHFRLCEVLDSVISIVSLPGVWCWWSWLGRYWKTVTRRQAVSNQPTINHVSTGLANKIVFEEVRILIKKCFNLSQFLTVILLEVVLSLWWIVLLNLIRVHSHCDKIIAVTFHLKFFITILCSHLTWWQKIFTTQCYNFSLRFTPLQCLRDCYQVLVSSVCLQQDLIWECVG